MTPQLEGAALSGLNNLILLAQSRGGFWLPPPESTTASGVDNVFYFLLAVSTFFFVLIVVLMAVFVFLYRRKPGVEPSDITHNNLLEVTWTSIPVMIAVTIFYFGFTGYLNMRTPPREAYEIRVTAQKWSWLFSYPNGYVSPELHVPVERPVRLTMTSEDVIHSLFIPAFRVKMDVVPGRYTTTWFQAVQPGTYDLYCAEYCGTGHSDMLTHVIVHQPGEFDKWLADEANLLKRMAPAEAGAELVRRNGCLACHTVDGSAKVGPSFKGIYGQTHAFTDGSSAQVDDNYIRESIFEPMAKVRQGYQPVMPTFKGRLKDDDVTAIIAYIKSLK